MKRAPGSWLVDAASVLVPSRKRDEWRREWDAELAWACRRLASAGEPGLGARLGLWRRAASCVSDAIHERLEPTTMTGIWNDVRFALRRLLRSPVFTTITVLTLALGIGANSAVFGLVDGVLLSPLPFPEPDRLVEIGHLGRGGADKLPISAGLYLLYKERARSLQSIAMVAPTAFNLVTDGDEPLRIDAASVTPEFFDVLGVEPALGRGFSQADGKPGADPVVILSDGLWHRQYGADPAMVGRSIVLDGTSRTVIGVAENGFAYPDVKPQLYVPTVVDPATAPLAAFGSQGIARLAPGATPESVTTELASYIKRLGELFPQDGAAQFMANMGIAVNVRPLKEAIVGDIGRTLWIIVGTVGFVLLIACANVANLFLVRAEGRHREFAIRVAVGASRVAVLRPLLAETLLLAIAGGALGVAIAAVAVRGAIPLAPPNIPRLSDVGIDLRVLAFTGAASLLAAFLFGVLPIVRYGRTDLASQLKEGGDRGGTGGRVRNRARSVLVVTQVALALVLLVGTGLMLRSFVALRSVPPGFDPDGVLTARLAVPTGEVSSAAETAQFYRELIQRIEALPGVVSASAVSAAPMARGFPFLTMDVENQPVGPDDLPMLANMANAEAGYFGTMGMRMVEGRDFQPGDGADGVRAAVVSEAFARKVWPGQSALGRRLTPGGPGDDYYEVVGVVADAHHTALDKPAEEIVYYPAVRGSPARLQAARQMDVVVRVASGDPMAFLTTLRQQAQALNPRIPLSQPRTMVEVVAASTARTSFTMVILAAAAGIALLLGLVGIYGVISYVVSQRTREIGVRMALGASAGTVRGMVVRQGGTLAAFGIVVGLVAAAALSKVMATLLYGVSAKDPLTYGGVAAGLALVALLGSWLPARRAAGVDPAVALRND
ncbi:MAG: ABC transporter permease [Gemmatimonadetes bacterium]|nr:ABC transporter permease [Gemmatimonadota bacterium]